MARRLNTRRLVLMLIFIGVPLLFGFLMFGGPLIPIASLRGLLVSSGNPQPYYEEAKKHVESAESFALKGDKAAANAEWIRAWEPANRAAQLGGRDPEIQYLLARVAMRQNPMAIDRAIQALRAAILVKPDYIEAHRMLTDLYMIRRYWKEAQAECDRLIKMDPTWGRAYLLAAAVDMGMADNEQAESKRTPYLESAVAHCQAGIEKAPETLELYRLMADAYGRLGQPEKVDDVWAQLLKLNPTMADAYVLRAGRLLQQQKPEDAKALLQQGLEKCGENAHLYIALGEIALVLRNPGHARECFDKAVKLDPKSESSYLHLEELDRADGLQDKALERLGQGLEQLPESLPLKYDKADLLLDMGKVAEAETIIEDISKTAPSDAAPLNYLRGKMAMREGKLSQAITYLEQARDRQPSPQIRFLLARAYMLREELGAAQHELDTLTEERPDLLSAWRMQAEVALRLHDLDKAARAARAVLNATPDDTDMRLLLSRTLAMRPRYAEALQEAQTAADRAPDNPEPWLLTAAIEQEMREMPKAEAALQKALSISRNSGRVYQRLLRFYTDTNQPDKVKTLLEEAKKNLPDEQYVVVLEDNPEILERTLIERTDRDDATVGDMLALARFYQLTARPVPAEKYLRKAMEKAPSGSPAWRQAWQQLFLLELMTDESFKTAADLIADLKKIDPHAEELLFAESVLAMSKGELPKATELLRNLIQSKEGRSLSQAYYLLGRVLVLQGNNKEAVTQLARALELRPPLSPARLLLGHIYLRQGNLQGALREANETLKYDAHLVPALELRAVAAAGLGSWPDALAAREEIKRLVPDNVGNLLGLSALYVQSHLDDKAEESLKAAYALAPNNVDVVRQFADFYADSNQAPKGEKILETYTTQHAPDAAAWRIRGEFAARTGHLDEAEKHHRTALKLDPKNPLPLILLGDDYARVNQWDAAIRFYTEAVHLAPDSVEAKRHLADVYMLKDQLKDARQLIEEVLKANPKDIGALVVAGRIASREDKVEEARRYMKQALEIEPNYGEAKVRLAELYSGPNPEDAATILKSVDSSDPAFETAMLVLSDIDTRRNVIGDAIMDLRRLLEYRPVSRPGRLALASKYMANHEPAKAVEICQELVKQSQSQDAGLLVMLADAQAYGNNFKDALANYQKARLLKSDLPEALNGECRCLVAMNRPQEAEQQAFHALDQDQKAVWPRLVLAALYEKNGKKQQATEAIVNGLIVKPDWEAGYVYLADMWMREPNVEQARKVLQEGLAHVPDSIALRAAKATLEIADQHPEAAKAVLEPLTKQFDALYGTSPERLDKLRPYMMPIRIYSLALYNMGQIGEAVKWGMRLWEVNPTDVANANNMAWILAVQLKDYAKATEMIDRCKRLVPNHPQVLDTAGWIEFLSGRYREAFEDLQASIKYGDNAEARYHLGRLYEVQEKPAEALAEYQNAMKMGLTGKDAEDAQQRIVKLQKP